MKKSSFDPGTYLFPVPSVMVSVADSSGNKNILTIAWVGTVNSKPPMIGIAVRPERYSYDFITQTKEFVVNIPDENLTWEADYCGSISGRKVNKFKKTGLTPKSGDCVKAPLLAEAPINLECLVQNIIELGSHHFIIGEVKKAHIAEKMLDQNGKPDVLKGKLITFGGKGYYNTNEYIFKRGDAIK
ncbi:flavin reductase family protein [Natranaerobius trueperi]|uniref:Flavin reductase n=1 Tax=Natranaerobius trueperi TaxID=759412 RepID=A0A226C0C0_9FIRM|nr:flavin reductase family protein [Natranaerobius trueperi]OWZ83817.1 flavin reductase [Natranaerobius trueperi]